MTDSSAFDGQSGLRSAINTLRMSQDNLHTLQKMKPDHTSQIFYLFRHAETDWNVIRRLQGHSDIDLNQQGETQAQNLSQRLTQVSFSKVISSDLIRARRTAEIGIISRQDSQLKLETTPDLREVNLGIAEGKTKEELIPIYGESFWENWSSHHESSLDLRFPGGESKREMLTRLMRCISVCLRQHPKEKWAFVSHGLALRTLTHFLHPELTETQFIGNCGALKMEHLGAEKYRLVKYFAPHEEIS